MIGVHAARTPRLGRPPATLGTAAGVCAAALLAAGSVAVSGDAPVFAVALVAGLLVTVVAVLRPLWVVAAGVLAIPLEGFFPGLIGPSQGLLGLAAVGWLVGWGSTRPLTIPRHPVLVGFAILVVANAAGLLFAPEPFVVVRQVITWGTLLIIAFAVAHSAGLREVRALLLAFAGCGGIAGIAAIIDPQPLTSVVFTGGDVSRATGGLGSPNALGMLLVLALPVQAVFAIRGTPIERVIGAGAGVLAMMGMTLAVSRGAFIGLGVALLVLALWPPFRKAAVLAAPLVVLLAMVGNNPESKVFDTSRVINRLTEVKTTGPNNSRLVLWEAAPEMIADRPIFGLGGLEYGYYTASYGIPSTEGIAPHPHNLLLTIVVESGLVGLTGLLMMFGGLAAGLRRVTRTATGMEVGLAYGLLASFAGFFVSGILDYALGAAPIAAAFFVPVGCAVALILRSRSTPAPRSPA